MQVYGVQQLVLKGLFHMIWPLGYLAPNIMLDSHFGEMLSVFSRIFCLGPRPDARPRADTSDRTLVVGNAVM